MGCSFQSGQAARWATRKKSALLSQTKAALLSEALWGKGELGSDTYIWASSLQNRRKLLRNNGLRLNCNGKAQMFADGPNVTGRKSITTFHGAQTMTTQEILAAVAAKKISPEEAAKLLPQPGHSGVFSIKVGEKGGLVIRGIPGIHARFGLSLYVETWEALQANAKRIDDFVKTNAARLSRKQRAA